MKDLIGVAILIATSFGGTLVAGRIYRTVREAAIAKTAQGLPPLTSFAHQLTGESRRKKEHRR